MKKRKNTVPKIICIVLSVLLIGVMAGIYYVNTQSSGENSARMQELTAQAKPYEEEREALLDELFTLQAGITYSSGQADILVGFVPTDADDLAYVAEKAELYAFTPVIVLDCALGTDVAEEILDEADPSWEIMLTVDGFSEETNADVLAVLALLEAESLEHSGIFLLRDDDSNASGIELLIEDGFLGYTSYNSSSPQAGQTEDGYVYFDYSYLTSSGTSVSTRLSALYKNKNAMLVVFDMASIHSGEMEESYVTELLDEMLEYTQNSSCAFSTVAEVTAELSLINALEEEQRNDSAERIAEIQERLEELAEIIHEIYSGDGE